MNNRTTGTANSNLDLAPGGAAGTQIIANPYRYVTSIVLVLVLVRKAHPLPILSITRC